MGVLLAVLSLIGQDLWILLYILQTDRQKSLTSCKMQP